jgi:hypothetical protein
MNQFSYTLDASIVLKYNSQGRIFCFWCINKTWNPPLGTSNTQRIVENGLEMKKLCPQTPPQVKGAKNSKKQTIEHYKG